MRLLLDTHVLLWWLDDHPALGATARKAISAAGNEVFVSAISAAEIAIKSAIGKLQVPDDLEGQLDLNAFTPLPLRIHHGVAVKDLPLHHRDPFDRLLIAQASTEGLTMVTADRAFAAYGIEMLFAGVEDSPGQAQPDD